MQDALTGLAEAERHGTSPAKRHALEERLAAAKATADQPWLERIAGSQSAVRDADQAVRAHVTAHLAELVDGLEADGQAAAERVNEAAAALVAGWLEREQIASSISQLVTKVAPVVPGDVSWSKGEEAFRAATALLNADGEEGPKLTRDRDPWARLLGGPRRAQHSSHRMGRRQASQCCRPFASRRIVAVLSDSPQSKHGRVVSEGIIPG